MANYNAPLNDMHFVLFDVLQAHSLSECPGYEDATEDMVRAVLDEAANASKDPEEAGAAATPMHFMMAN